MTDIYVEITDLALGGSSVLAASTMERLGAIDAALDEIDEASNAPNTLTGYRSDWRQLQKWGASFGFGQIPDPEELAASLQPQTIRAYLAERREAVAPATLTRHVAAIRHWHHEAGLISPTDHPTVSRAMQGIRRLNATDTKQARPLYLDELTAAVSTLDTTPRGVRNRALLLVGWWGAFRRSELVGIDRSHLVDDPQGVMVTLPRSKTDQEGSGRLVPLHYHLDSHDPVTALRAWLELVEGDPVFVRVRKGGEVLDGDRIDAQTVALVVKQAAASIGIDPALVSGHSLRAGFVSECDRRGIMFSAVAAVTGHKTEAMMSTYTRPRSLFDQSAGAQFD